MGLNILLLLFFAAASTTILLSSPAIYDSLSYRLPRIGQWLQAVSLAHFETIDQRQNWMPLIPDLMMGWVTMHTEPVFRGVQFVQLFGAMMGTLSVYLIARRCSLSPIAAQLAALMFLLMPNVFVQTVSSHTDLVAAGFAIAGLFFLFESFRLSRFGLFAGLAWALAFASKGTLFYWAPGLGVMVLLLFICYRPAATFFLKHAVCFTVFAAFFAGPKHVENHLAYGNPFANEDLIEQHHGQLSIGDGAKRTYLNALSYTAQVFEPFSNSPLLRPLTTALGNGLIQALPDSDEFMLETSSRRETWSRFFQRSSADSDGVSFGFYATLLSLAGAFYLWRTGGANSPIPRLMIFASLLFFVFFCFKQNAHTYAFRYFVLQAGPMAIAGAALLDLVPRRWRGHAAVIALLVPVQLCASIWLNNSQVGYNNIAQSDRIRNIAITRGIAELLSASPATKTDLIQLRLPYNFPRAGFYSGGQRITENAELDHHHGIVLPVTELEQEDALLHGRSFLFPVSQGRDFSCAFILQAKQDDAPAPFIKSYQSGLTPKGFVEIYQLHTNRADYIVLNAQNPTDSPHELLWKSGGEEQRYAITPHSKLPMQIRIGEDGEIRLLVRRQNGSGDMEAPDPNFVWHMENVNYPVFR